MRAKVARRIEKQLCVYMYVHHVSESMMPPDGGATGRMLGRLIGRVNRLVVQSLTRVIIAIVLLSLTVDVAVLTR